VGGGLRHAPGAARWAKAAPLAAEGDQLVVAAAAQSHEAVGQDPAFEADIELVLDELRQVGPGGGFDLGECAHLRAAGASAVAVVATRLLGRQISLGHPAAHPPAHRAAA